MTSSMAFRWSVGEPPPEIEDHSKAKLGVLRRYLRAYFERLNSNPSRDKFKLDLVDGFAGGGVFRSGGEIVSGTPLIMLEESMRAEEKLNQNRAKPLHFDFKYYFVDVDTAHTDYLKKELSERGHQVDGDKIVVRNSQFEDVADSIIAEIHRRQPRAGRALFLLDQCGFSRVETALVARIFRNLPTAEVILTFAADALVNHLADTPALVSTVAPIELTKTRIRDLIEMKNGDGGRALVQRVLRQHMRATTGALYDTPFFIKPRQSRRALWFLHLSRHPTARDVMIQCHWGSQNTFEHYGPGGFGMLGWDALKDGSTLPLFHFDELEGPQMHSQLLDSMPAKLYRLASEQPVNVDAVRHALANETATRFSDLDKVILELSGQKEFDVLDANGKKRRRNLQRLDPTDRIAVPTKQLLPGISRR